MTRFGCAPHPQWIIRIVFAPPNHRVRSGERPWVHGVLHGDETKLERTTSLPPAWSHREYAPYFDFEQRPWEYPIPQGEYQVPDFSVPNRRQHALRGYLAAARCKPANKIPRKASTMGCLLPMTTAEKDMLPADTVFGQPYTLAGPAAACWKPANTIPLVPFTTTSRETLPANTADQRSCMLHARLS